MKKLLFLNVLALCLCHNAMAETKQTVTINGEQQQGAVVTGIIFSGDDVTLKYLGGSTETVDMSLVKIVLDYDVVDGIENGRVQESVKNGKVYSVSGQYVGNSTAGLQKGVYIVNGKKVVIR